jgi:hypothetical protein
MNEINLSEFQLLNSSELDIVHTMYAFILCLLMSFILRSFYINRSLSLTGKLHTGSIIPILSAVVFLVITVVKSSLALSLGLVGALSIVRFRTPIKEPEELVYLFMAIAIGLGYAAGQILITTMLVLTTLFVTFIWLSNRSKVVATDYNMVLKWKNEKVAIDDIQNTLSPFVQTLNLIRMDVAKEENSAVISIVFKGKMTIRSVIDKLKILDDTIEISFFESKTNW